MDQADERRKRVELLNGAVEQQRIAARERTRTVETKASFLVVAAGALAGLTGTGLVDRAGPVGLVPLGLTAAAVAVAVAALWPRGLPTGVAGKLVDVYVESALTANELDDHLLQVRRVDTENREAQTEGKARLTRWGFALLVASVISGFVVLFDAEVVEPALASLYEMIGEFCGR